MIGSYAFDVLLTAIRTYSITGKLQVDLAQKRPV